jgi:hypothetical protein
MALTIGDLPHRRAELAIDYSCPPSPQRVGGISVNPSVGEGAQPTAGSPAESSVEVGGGPTVGSDLGEVSSAEPSPLRILIEAAGLGEGDAPPIRWAQSNSNRLIALLMRARSLAPIFGQLSDA